jgi:hypothetical protein
MKTLSIILLFSSACLFSCSKTEGFGNTDNSDYASLKTEYKILWDYFQDKKYGEVFEIYVEIFDRFGHFVTGGVAPIHIQWYIEFDGKTLLINNEKRNISIKNGEINIDFDFIGELYKKEYDPDRITEVEKLKIVRNPDGSINYFAKVYEEKMPPESSDIDIYTATLEFRAR